jgi:hypothetical protein
LPSAGDVRRGLDVDEIRPVPARDAEAFDAVCRIDFLEAHDSEQFGGGAFVTESERGGVETADRVILADAAAGPWHAQVFLGLDQREPIAIRTCEMETLLAETLSDLRPSTPSAAKRSVQNGSEVSGTEKTVSPTSPLPGRPCAIFGKGK